MKVHPHEVVAQCLPPHSLRAARVVMAQHLHCTRARQQWGRPQVPMVGLTALTGWWYGCLYGRKGLNGAGSGGKAVGLVV